MNFALINNNTVENVAEGDQAWADSVASDWQAVVNITSTTPQPGIGWSYQAGVFTAPVLPLSPEPAPTPEIRHITVGAFFDRFGDQKWSILADTKPGVQALIKDASVRDYINLDNPELLTGLQMVQAAGHDIDVRAIITAPIEPNERPK
jgi:hypothetical protein